MYIASFCWEIYARFHFSVWEKLQIALGITLLILLGIGANSTQYNRKKGWRSPSPPLRQQGLNWKCKYGLFLIYRKAASVLVSYTVSKTETNGSYFF